MEFDRSSRPNIADLFSKSSVTNIKNAKQLRLFQNLQWRQAYQHSEIYVYKLDDEEVGNPIEVRQIPNGELKGLGTGTFVWPAAHVLAKYFEKRFRRDGLNGKVVCDIGSGAGLTGFIAAYLGAKVILTDQSCIIPLLTENTEKFLDTFQTHVPREKVEILEYEWNAKKSPTQETIDIVIISDCVLPKLYPIDILIEAVDVLMEENTVAYFSYEHRPYPQFDPRQEFQRLCLQKGLEVAVVPLSSHHPNYCADDIEIWEVKRSKSNSIPSTVDGTGLAIVQWEENTDCIPIILNGRQFNIDQASNQGIGGALWPSSIIVSRFILKEFRKFLDSNKDFNLYHKGFEVLDLGAGCGLTSMALHAAGFQVTSTDKASLLSILQTNINNYLHATPAIEQVETLSIAPLDWENESSFLSIHPSLIVCSDCLYNSATVVPLLNVLEKHIADFAGVLLVNEMRTALEEFLYLARRSSTHTVTIQEIPIAEPSLEIVRNAQQIKFSPPLRMCFMNWQRISQSS